MIHRFPSSSKHQPNTSSTFLSRHFSIKPPISPQRRAAPSPLIFIAIFASACATFAYITLQRSSDSTDPRLRAKAFPSFGGSPVVSSTKDSIIFVLGGPGAGKGTQCDRLVKDYQFVHLSAGDLLRAEQQREGSSYGKMIKEYITEGQIVPMEVTIKLLENSIGEAIQNGHHRFLVDGFPRKMDQAIKFDEDVCESSFVLFLTCPEKTLLDRLLERGKTSGRDDDNEESISKRFKTFIATSMPVVDYYREKGKVVEIDSSASIDEVYQHIKSEIDTRLDF